MFGTSGIRGPVGEMVTASLALSVGRALGVDCDRVVVGRDPRNSGVMLADALTAGLRESGVDVLDLDVAATPTIARAVEPLDADAGVAITASHNPPPDNGIKLWQPGGQAFDEAMRERIETLVRTEETALVGWEAIGSRDRIDWRKEHCQAIVDAVNIKGNPDVVVDVGNGAGGVTVDALQRLGCSVQTLNAQQDGSFPARPSEPTPEHCTALASLVEQSPAQVGIAHDGDADRMRVVDETGEFLSGDVTLAILGRAAARETERVAVPVDTSLAVEEHLKEAGIETTRTRVGDVYVAAAARDPTVTFGGEPSGAWIWPEETLCPDGPLAACKIVALAAERSLADRAAAVDTYPIRREQIEVDEKAELMTAVQDSVTDAFENVSTLDGVRVDTDDGWFLIRASGTQPLIRLTAEGRTNAAAADILAMAREHVPVSAPSLREGR